MAKRYRIVLSPSEAKVSLRSPVNGEKEETSLRGIEVAMLSNLIEFAGSKATEIRKINTAADLIEQLDTLSEKQDAIILDALDRELVEKGIELTAAGRPSSWLRCRALWKQLESWKEAEQPSEQ